MVGRQGPEGVRKRVGASRFRVCRSVQLGGQPQGSIEQPHGSQGRRNSKDILMLLKKNKNKNPAVVSIISQLTGQVPMAHRSHEGCDRPEQEAGSLWATGLQILMRVQVLRTEPASILQCAAVHSCNQSSEGTEKEDRQGRSRRSRSTL